jgi:hypothetical protein
VPDEIDDVAGRVKYPRWAATTVLVIGGIGLTFVGVLALTQSIGDSSHRASLRAGDGVVVEGVVVDAVQQPGSVRAPIGQPRGHRYCPQYRFETPSGDIDFLEADSGCTTDRGAIELGHRADIVYDPDDTGVAYLADGGSEVGGMVLSGVALVGGAAILTALAVGAARGRRTGGGRKQQ